MPKGAVPTDPDGRREAVNVPVAAVRAPDGDLHGAGIVPVRETVEHHRGVGGSYRHRDRLSGSGVQVGVRRDDRLRREPPQGADLPCPSQGYAVDAAGRQKRNDTDTADWAQCRLPVTAAPTSHGFGGPFRWR